MTGRRFTSFAARWKISRLTMRIMLISIAQPVLQLTHCHPPRRKLPSFRTGYLFKAAKLISLFASQALFVVRMRDIQIFLKNSV
jgi:hypothetical protein